MSWYQAMPPFYLNMLPMLAKSETLIANLEQAA